ncbi:hypothetical protein FBU59_006593 [Linderina macrospora]|uniref:Uncharacterized protein n=1 Tax=Linderina macrospora TaxID=4868 RepID=A0ACC1IZL0_9FUNG|nr:hypothetical protein FBU59_006593 [Linderina macrospora]
MTRLFDLKYQFVKYGEYHNNPVNIAIHIVFVPTIMWTAISLLTSFTPQDLLPIPAPLLALLELLPGPAPLGNFPTWLIFGFLAFHIALEPIAGLLSAPFTYTIIVTAEQFALSNENAVAWSASLFVVAWIVQFIGHGVFEKRAPALLDNLVQAFVMAPFFVFLEILFKLGYRPSLDRELRSKVGVKILEFRSKTYGSVRQATE